MDKDNRVQHVIRSLFNNPLLILLDILNQKFIIFRRYKGAYENKEVAVKKMTINSTVIAEREIEILKKANSNSHDNIIRYIAYEKDEKFYYIALELCERTLKDFIEENVTLKHLNKKDILRKITKGLQYLHKLGMVHRDLKPQNILITYPDSEGNARIVISDFGFGKLISDEDASFSNNSCIGGTEGWSAPELKANRHKLVNIRYHILTLDTYFLSC